MIRKLLNAREVCAQLFGWEISTFYKKRVELEHAGFPRPVAGTRLYDPVAIEEWLALQRGKEVQLRIEGDPSGWRDRLQAWLARQAKGKQLAS